MKLIPLILLVTVAGCGKLGTLSPASPDRTPPRPINSVVPPTPAQQLILPPQSIPDRVDDPLKKSEDRRDDRFDLPPPGLR